MTTPQDPFSRPAPVPSTFPDINSFRGRLIFVEPTKIEHDVPKSSKNPNGPRGDRITATVTVIDGSEVTSPVQVFRERIPTGTFLEGNTFEGVWFNQDRVVVNLKDKTQHNGLAKMVLCRPETHKAGQIPGQGNAWDLGDYNDQDLAVARAFLQNRYAQQAASALPDNAPAATPKANPFSGDAPF